MKVPTNWDKSGLEELTCGLFQKYKVEVVMGRNEVELGPGQTGERITKQPVCEARY